MAELLGERGVAVAPRMYAEVFGREPAATRAPSYSLSRLR